MPLLLAPTAVHRLVHRDGEMATAEAAAAAGTVFCLSTLASQSIEEVGAASPGPRWFQLYVYRDRGITRELVGRAEAAGFEAILLTVDTPVLGRRERDERNAFALPADLSYANLRGKPEELASQAIPRTSAVAHYVSNLLDPSLSWADLECLVASTRLPVLVKGVVRGDDARRSVQSGARGVVVSNHGGRQLDYSIATLDALPEVAAAVGGEVPVLVDGGVRRGTDVLKARALGAAAVMVGRPYLWALALDGRAGVERLLAQFRLEILTSMSLLGVKELSDIIPDLLA
jgi:4-hydroxymandelate oxidase